MCSIPPQPAACNTDRSPKFLPSPPPSTPPLRDQETLHLHLQVVRSIVLLANDPVPSVCKVAYQLLKGVKEVRARPAP